MPFHSPAKGMWCRAHPIISQTPLQYNKLLNQLWVLSLFGYIGCHGAMDTKNVTMLSCHPSDLYQLSWQEARYRQKPLSLKYLFYTKPIQIVRESTSFAHVYLCPGHTSVFFLSTAIHWHLLHSQPSFPLLPLCPVVFYITHPTEKTCYKSLKQLLSYGSRGENTWWNI